MTDVMSGVQNAEYPKPATGMDGLDEQFVAQLLSSAKASGLKPTGEGHAQRAGWSFPVADGNAEPRKAGAPHRLLPMVKNFAELCAAYDAQRAEAIVKATTFYDDADVIAKVSRGLGEAMVGINVDDIPEPHRLAERGW